jgi:hypothetical protein
MTHEQPNSDCTVSEAMALRVVVLAMHDGNCPKCMHLASADMFQNCQGSGHQCPKCKFRISAIEADAALAAFSPYMEQNVEMFEAWRKRRQS